MPSPHPFAAAFYPVRRNASTPAVRIGRLVYWVTTTISVLGLLFFVAIGLTMVVDPGQKYTKGDILYPFLLMGLSFLAYMAGRGLRYVISDE